jgi:hypothetical protein
LLLNFAEQDWLQNLFMCRLYGIVILQYKQVLGFLIYSNSFSTIFCFTEEVLIVGLFRCLYEHSRQQNFGLIVGLPHAAHGFSFRVDDFYKYH